MQCERGQHITVRKLDLLTWGVLLARVLVKRDVNREESMVSSCIFSGDSPRCSHRYREKIVSRDTQMDQKASWVICYQYPLVSVTVVSKFWPSTKLPGSCPVWVFFQVYIAFTFYVGKVFSCAFKTHNSEVQFSAKCYSCLCFQSNLFPRAIELEYWTLSAKQINFRSSVSWSSLTAEYPATYLHLIE